MLTGESMAVTKMPLEENQHLFINFEGMLLKDFFIFKLTQNVTFLTQIRFDLFIERWYKNYLRK